MSQKFPLMNLAVSLLTGAVIATATATAIADAMPPETSTPVVMFEWAEDSVIRERFWVAKADQMEELMPSVIAVYDEQRN